MRCIWPVHTLQSLPQSHIEACSALLSFDKALQRVGPNGRTERLCIICNKWDQRQRSTFYLHHGAGKCCPDPKDGAEDPAGSGPSWYVEPDEVHDQDWPVHGGGRAACEGKRCPAPRQLRMQQIEVAVEADLPSIICTIYARFVARTGIAAIQNRLAFCMHCILS